MMSQRLAEGIEHKSLMKLLEIDYSIEYKERKIELLMLCQGRITLFQQFPL
jgi:hypothetical protein